jgi:DNA-binding transcriptional regulator LsrR (DeoR family)
MGQSDELRLIARVARMYYLENRTQSAIARHLSLSQASVSRLLKRGHDEKVIHISIDVPRGTFPDLEDRLRQRFPLEEAIVADCAEDSEESILASIGDAAAHFLESTLKDGEVIGISSWSKTLLRMVDKIHPMKRVAASKVVQTLGGMGNPGVEIHATQLTTRLARLTQAEPILLPSPGVAVSTAGRLVLVSDPYVRSAMEEFRNITVALLGIGAVQPSEMLARSGNVFTHEELAALSRMGAVGDISLRFFNEAGRPVIAPLDERVIGMTIDEIKAIPRVVALAGGDRKIAAIRGVLLSGLVHTLVTDRFTASKLAN